MFASVAGSPVLRARITIPMFGIPHGDAELDGDTDVTGDVQFVAGTLTVAMHAFRSGPFVGRRKVRLVGGHGGWGQPVPPQAYADPSGVQVSHVLGDVANICGETLQLAADSRPWVRYVREAMPGSRALNQILGQTWYVDVDGTTKNAPRSTSTINSQFQVEKYEAGEGRFVIAVDQIGDWIPARTFTSPTVEGVQTISSVTIMIDGSTARLEVETGTTDRLMVDLLSLMRETFPSLTFLGTYEYVVASGGFLPVDTTLGLPPIEDAELGLSLSTATLKLKDSVRIRFVDGRPWRPELCSAPASSTAITLGNASPAAAAREGDTVEITQTELTTAGAQAGGNPVMVSSSIQCKIITGSSQVQVG